MTPSIIRRELPAGRTKVERERATSAEDLQAEVRAWREREQELIEQLVDVLDDALRAVCELSP
jgi:hypothetical protein